MELIFGPAAALPINMKVTTLFLLLSCTIFSYGCGSGGGGGETISSNATISPEQLMANTWVMAAATSAYGNCAYVTKFLENGRFGITQVCQVSPTMVMFEAIYGSFSTDGSHLNLKLDNDNCSKLGGTALREASGIDTQAGFQLSIDTQKQTLTIVSSQATLRFIPIPSTATQILDPRFMAIRGCNKHGSTYAWQYYDTTVAMGSFDPQFNNGIAQNLAPSPDEGDIDITPPEGVSVVPVPADNISPNFSATGTLSMSNATGSVSGALYAANLVSGAGVLYTRTNAAGDKLKLYVDGSAVYGTGYTQVQATVIVSLAPTTVEAFKTICGQGPVRAEFNYNILASGTLPSAVKLVAANGCYGNI